MTQHFEILVDLIRGWERAGDATIIHNGWLQCFIGRAPLEDTFHSVEPERWRVVNEAGEEVLSAGRVQALVNSRTTPQKKALVKAYAEIDESHKRVFTARGADIKLAESLLRVGLLHTTQELTGGRTAFSATEAGRLAVRFLQSTKAV